MNKPTPIVQHAKLRLVRKSETAEWLVKVWINGKFSERETYYTDDKGDAVDTMQAMMRILTLKGFAII